MKSSNSIKTERKGRRFGEAGTRRFVVTMATFAVLLPAVMLLVLRTKESAAVDNKLRANTNGEKQSDEGYVEILRRLQTIPNGENEMPVAIPAFGENEVPGAISSAAISPAVAESLLHSEAGDEVEKKEAYVHHAELETTFEENSVQQDELPSDEMASIDQEDATIQVVGEAEKNQQECFSSGNENRCGVYKVEPIMVSSLEEFQRDSDSLVTYKEATDPGTRRRLDPVVGQNFILIQIDAANPFAGSGVPFIQMYFENEQFPVLFLMGFSPGIPFPPGAFMLWNLNTVIPALQTINSDRWDNIILQNPSGDGILIDHIIIVHSDMWILNWNANVWLDGDQFNPSRRLSLADQILQTKLAMVPNSWIGQLHHAARELGKTGKYGSADNLWSNEFANWCLRKTLWGIPPPTGPNVFWWQIAIWFAINFRLFFGLPNPHPGDWVALPGGRSGLFVQNFGGGFILTIEGDLGGAVRLNIRPIGDVLFKGNTR